MLDTTNTKRPVLVGVENRSIAPEPWRDGIGFRVFLGKVRQRRPKIVGSMLVGAVVAWLAGLGYNLVKVPEFSASSELLISNTTLQLSGPDAVVTQILVENSLIQSAIEMLKSSKVLERTIDRIGLENIERILPRSPWQILAYDQEPSEATRRQTALARLRSNMKVSRIGASQIISVREKALTAEDAARLTNDISGSFVQEQNDTNAVITTSAALRERIKVLGPTARIISEAAPPDRRDGPGPIITLVLAPFIGVALGFAVGLGFTLVDRRVRSAEQLASVTSVECFGYLQRIPSKGALGGFPSGAFRNGCGSSYSHVSVPSILPVLRRARAAVLERSRNVPHFVGITSYAGGGGKTTIAANWARLIASDGSRVLFVSASPGGRLASGSQASAEPQGLYEMLRGEVAASEVIRVEIQPNLDFLPSGKLVGNIDMQWYNLVQAVGARGDGFYEWIILDLPPLQTVADVRSAGQVVDDLLIVVEWGRTSESELEWALRSLGPVRDKILGTFISRSSANSGTSKRQT
ncbi:AAA family ATPase [Bradyrhizobium sp. AZCC 1693]|uniref:AAA family ATPase n=1 Tax=Bradyrhizobium sp. AZCC 1693 TaxID=3117029 RepID=UPI002FF24874